jgi:hypothetical protein
VSPGRAPLPDAHAHAAVFITGASSFSRRCQGVDPPGDASIEDSGNQMRPGGSHGPRGCSVGPSVYSTGPRASRRGRSAEGARPRWPVLEVGRFAWNFDPLAAYLGCENYPFRKRSGRRETPPSAESGGRRSLAPRPPFGRRLPQRPVTGFAQDDAGRTVRGRHFRAGDVVANMVRAHGLRTARLGVFKGGKPG